MRTAGNVIARLVVAAMLLSLTGTANAVELTTGLLRSRGDNDHIDCCVANTDNVDTTLFDIVLYNNQGSLGSLNYLGKTPVTIPAQQGSCVEWIVNPGFYRCVFVLPDTTAERVRATLAILDDHHGILGELEGHPVPELPPCAQAGAPQCNGTCPPGSGSCLFSGSRCFCGIR
jgi:hypothetical protein